MASNVGTAIIDFGVYPGSTSAFLNIADPTSPTDAYCSAWFYSDQTVDGLGNVPGTNHTHTDHENLSLFCSLQAGYSNLTSGFYIFAQTLEKVTGTFKVKWAYSDGI